jgi:hypothetical protein
VTPLVRRYIKTSFVFLLLGVLLGGYIVIAEFVVGSYPSRLLIRPMSTCCSSASS